MRVRRNVYRSVRDLMGEMQLSGRKIGAGILATVFDRLGLRFDGRSMARPSKIAQSKRAC